MADADQSPATPPTPPAAPGGSPGQPPWHQGIESDVVGTWQNKGYDLGDPKKIAVEVTKAYREAQAKLGVPPDQLLKLLKPDSQPNEIKEFWNRLGSPKDPKEYDFAGLKFSDGRDLDPRFVENMRKAFDDAHLPKDAARTIASAIVKYQDASDAEKATTATAKLRAEKTGLAQDWGEEGSDRWNRNLFIARQGALALNINGEALTAIENATGYRIAMQALHKIGMLNKEEQKFFTSGAGNSGIMTREQALSRWEDLKMDEAWTARFHAGDVRAKAEWQNLTEIISGQSEAA